MPPTSSVSMKKTFTARFGRAQRFDATPGPDGRVRTAVWDRFCTLGQKIKEGEESVFDQETLGQMVANWYARGGRLAMCQDHKSAATPYVSAPALAFYDALAIVVDGQIVLVRKLAESAAEDPDAATLVDSVKRFATEDNPDPSPDGLWGWRCEVTPLGQDAKEGLRNYKGISPMFLVDGKDEQERPIGYVVLDVAATNTSFQAGCEITFSIGGAVEPPKTEPARRLVEPSAASMSNDAIETVHEPSYKVGDRLWRGGEDNPLEIMEVIREGTTGQLRNGKWVKDWLYRTRDAKGREGRMWFSEARRRSSHTMAVPPGSLKNGDHLEYRDRQGSVRRGRIIARPDGDPTAAVWVAREDDPDRDDIVGWTDVIRKLTRKSLLRHHNSRQRGFGAKTMKILQKLGLSANASVAQKMARYGAFVFAASNEELTEMATDLSASGDAEAEAMAQKLRRFAGDEAVEGAPKDENDDDDGLVGMAVLAQKLGVADASPDELHEALGRFAQTCKMKFAEAMEDPSALAQVMSEVAGVLSHDGAEHMDAYAEHFEGLKRFAENLKRFASDPVEPVAPTMAAAPTLAAAPTMAATDDPEGDAIVHAFARKRGIDPRRTPRAVILGAMVASGAGSSVSQATIDKSVQAALTAEKVRATKAANAARAAELFAIATKCGFAAEAKSGFMTMAHGNIADAEVFVNSLPGAKAMTRMTVGGAPVGSTTGGTPQAGLRPGGEDARVNVDLADRSQQLVDKAKTDPQTMSRLTKIAGTQAHPGMLLAAAQKIVSEESPEIVEWAQPSSSPLLGLV